MAITLDKASLQLMGIFDKITHAHVKDVFEDQHQLLTFVVGAGQLRKALGVQGANIKRLEKVFKRKLRVIEYADDVKTFVSHVVYPAKCDIAIDGDVVTLVPHDLKGRGYLIGRAATYLKNTEMIIKRYFPIQKVVVTKVKDEEL